MAFRFLPVLVVLQERRPNEALQTTALSQGVERCRGFVAVTLHDYLRPYSSGGV